MTPEELAALSERDLMRLESEAYDEVEAGAGEPAFVHFKALSDEIRRRRPTMLQRLEDTLHDTLATTSGCHHPTYGTPQCRALATALYAKGVRKEFGS